MESDVMVTIVAVVAIAAIVIVALCHGVDSVVTGSGCAIIGSVVGWFYRKFYKNRKGRKNGQSS